MKQHNCIDKIRKRLMKEDKRLKFVRFDLSNLRTWERNKIVGEEITGQRIKLGFERKKKTGETVIKERNTFIGHDFCPFCGKKYKN